MVKPTATEKRAGRKMATILIAPRHQKKDTIVKEENALPIEMAASADGKVDARNQLNDLTAKEKLAVCSSYSETVKCQFMVKAV